MFKRTIRNEAFTLAEVLITLGIIGIIAAMTIPMLITNIQDAQFRSAYKKTFAELTHAYTIVLDEYGGDYRNVNFAGNGPFSRDSFCNQLNCIKKCIAMNTCWQTMNDITYLGGGKTGWLGYSYVAILNSGAFVQFRDDSVDCSYSAYFSTPMCSQIVIDVNGDKKPNILGRDVFLGFITKNKFLSAGAGLTDAQLNATCTKSGGATPDPNSYFATWIHTTTNTGSTCGTKILRNINY